MLILVAASHNSFATSRTASASGNWGDVSTWGGAVAPSATDDVIIPQGVSLVMNVDANVKTLNIFSGASLTLSPGFTLTLNGSLNVSGSLIMNNGNITQNTNGASFVLGNNATFEWEPGNNTVAGATLFTRGNENFSQSSTLKIKKWYDYANVPLGNVVSGNFGNLVLNSASGLNIVEWNQNNQFQSHQVQGTLTVDQGWITLDRSGSISNTTVGNILLTSVNSSLYIHRGNHPGSFTLNTNSVSITNGTFYGLLDGTGNITLNVNGNFTTNGNFKLNYNDGVLNVGNGNGTLSISGTYTQTAGDTRLIYNISTTNSGIYNFTAGNISFSGGIFMGQYGCHSAGLTATISISNNLTLNFSSSSDIFRFNGLTSLSGNMNTLKLNLSVGGNFNIASPNNGAEFTSASAQGVESISINGNMTVNGGKVSFNYGFPTAAHDVTFTLAGNMTVSNGVFNLSKHIGTGTFTINGNLTVSNGTLALKGDDGVGALTVNGAYQQSGGLVYLHYNNLKVSTAPSSITINGDFTQSGGTINFDDNSSNVTETHQLIINGPNYNLTGNGIMTHAGAGTCTVFGLIQFSRNGTTVFNRSAAGHSITQVKQVIKNGTTLDLMTGSLQLASHTVAATDYLTVEGGGTLKMRGSQIFSNAAFTYSGFNVKSNGTVSTMNLFGLYDGTDFAAVKASGNMDFYLDANSTVEYNGWSNQVITGIGAGMATTTNHKYGILRINFNGTPDVNYLYPTSSNIFVRTRLELARGEFYLNGYNVTIENGASDAITRTIGYVKTESQSVNNSFLTWKNVSSGTYVFPFGKNSAKYIPVIFAPSANSSGNVSIRTRATGTNNQPFPLNANSTSAISISSVDPTNDVVDRWWDFKADGFTADVTLTYPGEENTLAAAASTGMLDAGQWNNGSWNSIPNVGTGVTSGLGTVTVTGASVFSSWMVSAHPPSALPLTLLDFNAKPATSSVLLSWATALEVNNDFFTIEKSNDGNNFSLLVTAKGAGNSSTTRNYRYSDNDVEEGIIYYRLSQTDFDGTHVNLKTVSVNLGNVYFPAELSIENVFPNPFEDKFDATFTSSHSEITDVKVSDMNGRVISSDSFESVKGTNIYSFRNSTDLKPGIYFISLSARGKTVVKKLIKH